jgi:N4-gp56 family major capsid protein
MPFTLNLSGTSQVDDSIILAYDQQFIVAAAQMQVMDQFVSYKKSIGAKSIQFPKYAQLALATTPLDEVEDVVSEAMADQEILLLPLEYGKVVTTTLLASLQTGGTSELAKARLVGMNLGRTLDKLAILACDANSTNIITPLDKAEGDLLAGDVMSVSFLNRVYNKLARTNIMPLSDGMYVGVMHEDQIADLRSSVGSGSWVDINKYSRPETVLRNEVGMVAGFKIIMNNHVTIGVDAGDGTVDTYRAHFLGFNALGKAVSYEPSLVISGPHDKLARFLNLGWKGVLRYGIVDQDAIYTGITASSVGANA